MVFPRLLPRFIHFKPPYAAAEKSLLATLRKKTGYTFSNCKKALDMHNNDLKQAEKWLKEQAQTLGWSKATKLEGRQTSQGLIGVIVSHKDAALVEVNCETDFVARNKEFQKVVEVAALSCLEFAERQARGPSPVTKIGLDSDQVKSLPAPNGKSLADHLALMIGAMGENASLRRALCFKGAADVVLAGYAHPSSFERGNVLLGKFGGLIAVKQVASTGEDVGKLARNLCQHVVGMNPKKVGEKGKDEPAGDGEEETCLVHQEYLLDEEVCVGDLLEESGVEIVDFHRFECGEDLNGAIDIDLIETCQ